MITRIQTAKNEAWNYYGCQFHMHQALGAKGGKLPEMNLGCVRPIRPYQRYLLMRRGGKNITQTHIIGKLAGGKVCKLACQDPLASGT